jgi:hypothetical protein
VQALLELHETLFSTKSPGVLCTDQLSPFHRSMSVPEKYGALEVMEEPTATQAMGDVHDTPPNPATFAPAGSGIASNVQLEPSQRSASGRRSRPPPTE